MAAEAPLHLGPPPPRAGMRPAGPAALKVKSGDRWRADFNSAPLVRLLVASDIAAAKAGGAGVVLAFRADPERGACFLWLAPAGATGDALAAPTLPEGVAQLSAAALAEHKKRKK